MMKSLAALGAAGAVLCAPALSLAQTYPKVLGPGGSYVPPNPSLIFVQTCNGGLGGFVGSTYSGTECLMPGASGSTAGLGAQQLIPTTGTSTTPVAIGPIPSGAVGVRLYAPTGTCISFTVASSATLAASQIAAGAFKTFCQAADGPNWDENLSGGMNLYVDAITGAGTPSSTTPVPSFRYY
jgi:hypothetical protein